MMSKMVLLVPARSRYSSLQYFCYRFAEAATRFGMECSLIELDKYNFTEILNKVRNLWPDLTVSFNGILPDSKRGFLSDFVGLPHLSILVDPPYGFLPLKDSPYSIISCVDQSYCDFFEALGFQNTFFLPHAFDYHLASDSVPDPDYDIVFLGTCIDHEAVENEWKGRYSKILCKKMGEVADIVLNTPYKGTLEALCKVFGIELKMVATESFEGISLMELWPQIDLFIRGKDRIELLKSIKDAKVHVFGDRYPIANGRGWNDIFNHTIPHVISHPSVPYSESLGIVEKSKIVLNSVPIFKNGSHERIFTGLACDTFVMTNSNRFIDDNFHKEDGVAVYSLKEIDALNQTLHTYLQDDERRLSAVERGKKKVLEHHTWDARIKSLIWELPICLQRIET